MRAWPGRKAHGIVRLPTHLPTHSPATDPAARAATLAAADVRRCPSLVFARRSGVLNRALNRRGSQSIKWRPYAL